MTCACFGAALWYRRDSSLGKLAVLNSQVYTNAAIFHRELLNEYTCTMPREIRDMVSTIRSCEDIAMNVLSYAKWGSQPIGITTERKCVDNYGIAPQFKRDEGGLAKKGDMPTYALFRGGCGLVSCVYFVRPPCVLHIALNACNGDTIFIYAFILFT
eukprot:m.166869 g.166869  ORF g.166869 m.166869 type:complete len:157 (-) comp18174_c0_seq4:41-511(-)